MFETNIQNNSALISLARAAEITGYHQDYLGQLCRLGRLPAKKVGRNWFTTSDALREFNTPVNKVIENEITPAPMAMDAISAPGLTRTTVVSQVEGLPIMIKSVPTQAPSTNTVQTIASNMRIQALQREVQELREMLTRLMTEVAKHAELLGSRSSIDLLHSQEQRDSLRHSYVSNFDFSPPQVSEQSVTLEDASQPSPPPIWIAPPRRQYSIITWTAATASLAAIAYLGVSIATGMFWGQEPTGRTVYYQQNEPEVAGAESPTEPVTGESLLNVLK